MQVVHVPASGPWPGAFLHSINSMYHNQLIWLFIIIVVMDIISGFAKGLITRKIDSSIGLVGITKHFVIIGTTLILYPLLDATKFSPVGDTWVVFYITFYLISLVENWGQMGLPLPPMVKDYVKKLADDQKKELK